MNLPVPGLGPSTTAVWKGSIFHGSIFHGSKHYLHWKSCNSVCRYSASEQVLLGFVYSNQTRYFVQGRVCRIRPHISHSGFQACWTLTASAIHTESEQHILGGIQQTGQTIQVLHNKEKILIKVRAHYFIPYILGIIVTFRIVDILKSLSSKKSPLPLLYSIQCLCSTTSVFCSTSVLYYRLWYNSKVNLFL